MNCMNCGQEVPEINQGQFCPFCGASLAPGAIPPATTSAAENAYYCAWEDRDKLGFIAALSQTWTEAVLRPAAFFKKMPRTGGIGAPMLYAVLIGSIGALFSLFWEYQLFDKLGTMPEWPDEMPFQMSRNLILVAVPFVPFVLTVSLLLMSLVYHVCLLITGSAKNGWEVTFRVIAYASGPSLFLFMPICGGVVAAVWSWVLQIIGWTHAHESTSARVLVAALIPLFVCCGFVLWAVMMFAGLFRDLPIPQALAGHIVRTLLP